MSFELEADKKQLELNVVVQIDGLYYATKQVDSGLVVDTDKLVVTQPRVNGVTIDIRKVSTPIGSFSFRLFEDNDNPVVSSTIMQDVTQWLKKECIVYAGFITGSFDFADYKEIARTRIQSVTKVRNGYSIRSQEVTGLVDNEALNVNDTLQTAMLSTTTTLDVTNGDNFPSSGLITINGEFIAYSSKTDNTLENLTRGLLTSEASEHEVGENIFLVTEVLGVNPIDLMLQVMLSVNGDGTNDATYDVLEGGLGISPNDIDIASFESIRNEFFNLEQHSYYIYDNTSMLKFLERTVLVSTNTRLITIDGKISLALLDQVNFEEEVNLLDESMIVGTPTWSLDESKIVNKIEVSYDFNVATQNFESLATFQDDDSITNFGAKKPLRLKFEGVKTTLDGGSIVTDRATRLLGRLSTARGKINVTSHFGASNYEIGGNVQLVHRFLPQQGGTLGFSDRLEIMSRSIDLAKATVKTSLEFTSYTGIRLAFIAPSPRIVSVVDQKTIVVDNADCLKEGFSIKLFKDGPLDGLNNPTIGSYLPDDANLIQSITGNEVTFTSDFVSVLGTDITLKMSDYDLASEEQKARYGFIGFNTGFFADGSKSYQIIF